MRAHGGGAAAEAGLARGLGRDVSDASLLLARSRVTVMFVLPDLVSARASRMIRCAAASHL